jgi:hypothetical protein
MTEILLKMIKIEEMLRGREPGQKLQRRVQKLQLRLQTLQLRVQKLQ